MRSFRASEWENLFSHNECSRKVQVYEVNAEIAQLVEHNLAKVGVASSSLVFRSIVETAVSCLFFVLISPACFLAHIFCLSSAIAKMIYDKTSSISVSL